jgi:hypothetical protein
VIYFPSPGGLPASGGEGQGEGGTFSPSPLREKSIGSPAPVGEGKGEGATPPFGKGRLGGISLFRHSGMVEPAPECSCPGAGIQEAFLPSCKARRQGGISATLPNHDQVGTGFMCRGE